MTTCERVVPAPELPVRAERALAELPDARRAAKASGAEHDGSTVGQTDEVGARPRARPRCEQPEEAERDDPRHVEDPELCPREHREGDRAEDEELAQDLGRSSATAIAYSAHTVVRNERLSVITVATETEEGIATDEGGREHRPPRETSRRASRYTGTAVSAKKSAFATLNQS